MFSYTLALVFVAFTVVYFFLLPVITYLRDPKGLRRYPNFAPLAGVFDIPYCYLSACGFRSRDLTEAHKKHPVLRIGPNNLSFGHIDAIKAIYGHSTSCVKDLKYVITSGEHPNLFDVVEKFSHAEKRKRLSAAFATKNLERWVFKVARTTERLLSAFDERCVLEDSQNCDSIVDFNHWINLFTIDAINYIALSSDLNLIGQGNDTVTAERRDGSTYTAQYRKSQNTSAYATSHFVWDYTNFRSLVWLSKLIPRWRRTWNEAEPWKDVIYHQVVARRNRKDEDDALDDFYTALNQDKAGKSYDLAWDEIVNEVGAIIDAGADTTAIALTQVLELLIKHPEHLRTLRNEVDAVMTPSDVVAPYESVKNLPFLRACLDEAMRFIPPTSAGLPRRTPSEGAEILGEWIPGDTSVSMPIYTAHHCPSVWAAPEEFQPHRWMDAEDRKRLNPYFIPFSTGGRGCLGRNISYLEQTVVLASLVHRYEFAFADAGFELKRFEAFNLIVGEMPIRIWRRDIGAVRNE